MTRRRIIILAAVAVLLAAVSWVFWSWHSAPHEPVYKGKTLTAWLEQYDERSKKLSDSNPDLDWTSDPEVKEAESAIRQIGTNGLPTLLWLVRAEDPRWKEKVISMMPKRWQWSIEWAWIEADNRQSLGTSGLEILGADAKPIVPELIKMLNSDDPHAQRGAAYGLGCIGPDAGEAVPALIRHFSDPDQGVRNGVAMALGRIHSRPDLVVPVLCQGLKGAAATQPDQFTILLALSHFRQDGKSGVPAIAPFLTASDIHLKQMATNALKHIAPDGATNGWANYKKP